MVFAVKTFPMHSLQKMKERDLGRIECLETKIVVLHNNGKLCYWKMLEFN